MCVSGWLKDLLVRVRAVARLLPSVWQFLGSLTGVTSCNWYAKILCLAWIFSLPNIRSFFWPITLPTRTVLLPMALLVFLFFTQSFSGSNMVSYYTITIFQVWFKDFDVKIPTINFVQMANIPLDENLASVLVAAQYVLGYRWNSNSHSKSWSFHWFYL